MSQRDRVAELIAIKERSGRRGGRFPDFSDVHKLKEAWDGWTGPKELFGSLLPARLVTLIEVFCRYWVQKLIDRGSPYVEHAVDLKVDVKYDLALARSLQGKTISLGLLLSNSVSLSKIDAISSVFSILLKQEFFDWLSKVRSRASLEHDDDSAVPIVLDVQNLRRILGRTFDVRHVLVHEFPEKSPYAVEEIDEMIAAAGTFIDAADEGFTQLLYGLYPIAQQEMNRVAREESDAAYVELTNLADEVMKKESERTILAVQLKWDAFAKAEAERIARIWTGGSMYPLQYHTAFEVLISDRIRQLRSWFEEMFPDA